MQFTVTEMEGNALCLLAKWTIVRKLGIEVDPEEWARVKNIIEKPIFSRKNGVFVTLHRNGELRGCIGSLFSDVPIRVGVEQNAISAAFQDYRFPQLCQDELPGLAIEISILSSPEDVIYDSADWLLQHLESFRPGVIVSKGAKKATFLPQVWTQLSDPAEFLSHLCAKAGLPSQEWRLEDVRIQTYSVLSFQCCS